MLHGILSCSCFYSQLNQVGSNSSTLPIGVGQRRRHRHHHHHHHPVPSTLDKTVATAARMLMLFAETTLTAASLCSSSPVVLQQSAVNTDCY